MLNVLVTIALLQVGATAVQQPSSSIWNDLKLGMTKAEVKGRYPKNRVELGEGCLADLSPRFTDGLLNEVDLEWSARDSNHRCADVVEATLLAKYGATPMSDTQIKLNDCGSTGSGGVMGALAGLCQAAGGDNPEHFVFSRWARDGIEITLKRQSERDDFWWLVYRPAVQPSATAASKL